MRILLLSDVNSAHTRRWAEGLSKRGMEVGIFSISSPKDQWHLEQAGIQMLHDCENAKSGKTLIEKLGYLKLLRKLKQAINKFQPEIVHAHYATSYGLLGVLSGFQPLVISTWGTDVFSFPKKTKLHARLLTYIFSKANVICSTSYCMKEEIAKYMKREVKVIPFGVDEELFYPEYFSPDKTSICIGNIKALETGYGNNLLLIAFGELVKKYKHKNLKLLLVGDGPQRAELVKIVEDLKLSNFVELAGKIPHAQVAAYHRKIDIFVSPTLVEESFGVSLVESMASGKAVVASDTPGFMEVLASAENGTIVKRNSVSALTDAISKYIESPVLMINHGKSARIHVSKHYVWKNNLDAMIEVYKNIK